ncbi:MAG: filamentous hemagglutinin N-terminal domain-containing protein, partial [Betaproteobacteria bacterium]
MKYSLLQGLRWYMLSMAVTASAQVSAPVSSSQLPTGGKVMSGTTSIQSVGNVLNINQSSQRSAIDWNTFNVGGGAKVNFIQPSANSVTLNRVLDTNGSQILGSISANGQVFISNPNGVLFGPNSQVNVGGLLATTQNISVDDFMAGKSTFEGTGGARSVVNQGKLEAALGGYIALLAPSVRNEGVVLAREGTVVLAAGDKTVVQFNGPQLVTVMVDRSVLDALVENKQMVRADGGLVIFSARSANAVLSS